MNSRYQQLTDVVAVILIGDRIPPLVVFAVIVAIVYVVVLAVVAAVHVGLFQQNLKFSG